MSHLVRKSYLLVSLLSFLGGCLVVLLLVPWLGSGSDGAVHGTGGADVRDTAGTFTISGDATRPIVPGVGVPLNLTITNPHGFAISVSRLTVDIGSVDAPNSSPSHPCSLTDFTVVQVSAGLEISIAAHTTGTLDDFDIPPAALPQVAMLDRPVNQDGCQGATLTLDYSATGTQDS